MSATTLDPEWQLLLAACSAGTSSKNSALLHPLLRPSVRWQSLFALADHHGVQPLLFQTLKSLEAAVPPAEMLAIAQSSQTNLHKSLLLARELIRIVDHLSSLNLEVIPYKGLALAELIYRDIALRQPGDIDLLIHADDFPRIHDAVHELGYTAQTQFSKAQERAYLKSGYECAFDGAAGRNLLEVQWAVLPRFYAMDFDMNGLFDRAVTVTVAGRPMKTPCPADLLLVLAVHAAKHVWSRLVWLCDIARLIAQLMSDPDLPWDWVESQARSLGIARIVSVSLLLSHRLLGAALPPGAEELVAADPASHLLAQEIQTRIATNAAMDVESVAYFRLMMRLRERRADRVRFLQRLIFTPGPGEWNAIRLPQSLFPLYRVVRLSRLAARLIRT